MAPQAVSEQALLERAIDRLPSGSTVIGDANFGVFSVAYAATQRQHPVLLRLTAERARQLGWGTVARWHRSRAWCGSPVEPTARSHPDLPADACV